MKNKKGITLIALIITIVVLLILAGVSINAIVGENGILTQAQNASKKTNEASEMETIEFVATDVKTDLLIDGTSDKIIGEPLTNKQIGIDWNVIVFENNTYGTGWYYIEKGQEISNYGKTKMNWIVNYESGKVINLGDNYSKFSSADTSIQSAKENLVFNLDGTIIDNATNIKDLKWSEGSEPVGFDEINENSRLDKKFN